MTAPASWSLCRGQKGEYALAHELRRLGVLPIEACIFEEVPAGAVSVHLDTRAPGPYRGLEGADRTDVHLRISGRIVDLDRNHGPNGDPERDGIERSMHQESGACAGPGRGKEPGDGRPHGEAGEYEL